MSTVHVITLNPKDHGNAQSSFPGADDDWFIAIDKGDYMIIERHDRTPPGWRDEVRVVGQPGHITSTSWRDLGDGSKGEIWSTFGSKVCRFPYVKNATITKKDVTFVDVFHTGGVVQISLSLDGLTGVVRTHSGGYSYFRQHLVEDLLAGRNHQIGKTIKIKRTPVGDRVEQSFGVHEGRLYTGYGASNKPAWVEIRDFLTGKLLDDPSVENVGRGTATEGWLELECAPGDLVAKKVNTGAQRRIVVDRLATP